MEYLLRGIAEIKESLERGDFDKAKSQENIRRLALDFVGAIKKGKLTSVEIDQVSDSFFILWDIQLQKKCWDGKTEEILQQCFSLHSLLPETNKSFIETIDLISTLCKR